MTVVTMVVRLDLYSVVYGTCLGILVLLSRRCCYCLWRGYVIMLMVLLFVQYLSCVGAPLALCWGLYSLLTRLVSSTQVLATDSRLGLYSLLRLFKYLSTLRFANILARHCHT